MWRGLLLLLLLLFIVPQGVVLAGNLTDYTDITVTARGYVGAAPSGLTVAYISDYEVGLNWTKGVDIENTMIRVDWGRTPTSRTDGYLLYYGNATSYLHFTSIATGTAPIHYALWNQRADGMWVEDSTTAEVSFMSLTVLFVATLILGLALFIAAFRWKDILLSYAAALTWMAIGFWWIVGDLTNFGLSEDWSRILVYVPFVLAFSVLLRLWNTEIKMESKGKSWTEWGPAPKGEPSNRRLEYRKMLRERIR